MSRSNAPPRPHGYPETLMPALSQHPRTTTALSSSPGDPSTTSSIWLVDREGELRVCGSYFAQDIKDLAGQGVGVNDRQELEPRATGVR